MTIASSSTDLRYQEAQERATAAREFVNEVVFYLTGAPSSLSLAARVAFITVGRGMRLVIDKHPHERQAGLVMHPDFSKGSDRKTFPVPADVAREMIESGVMRKLDSPASYNGRDADWWCMII